MELGGQGRVGEGGSDGEGHRQDQGVVFLPQDGVTAQTGQEPVSRMCVWTWEESGGTLGLHHLLWRLVT